MLLVYQTQRLRRNQLVTTNLRTSFAAKAKLTTCNSNPIPSLFAFSFKMGPCTRQTRTTTFRPPTQRNIFPSTKKPSKTSVWRPASTFSLETAISSVRRSKNARLNLAMELCSVFQLVPVLTLLTRTSLPTRTKST